MISSLVSVTKKGKTRICTDPKPLNRALKRSHFPLSTIDDNVPELSKAKVFTVLDIKHDIKHGFWYVSLEEESHHIRHPLWPILLAENADVNKPSTRSVPKEAHASTYQVYTLLQMTCNTGGRS